VSWLAIFYAIHTSARVAYGRDDDAYAREPCGS